MKSDFLLFILICQLFFFSCLEKKEDNIYNYDLVIYGGTSAGVMAAYAAKNQGKSVLLIEHGNHLGGLSSGGLGYTDIGNKSAVKGLALDFYRRIGKRYGVFEQSVFEPHVAESIFDSYMVESKVDVWKLYRLIDVKKEDYRIAEITLESSKRPIPENNKIIKAQVFIDASYEGDLMAKANVSYTVGREGNDVYNEKWNGVQLLDKHQFIDGIDPYVIPKDPKSGLLWGISNSKLPPIGSGDKKIQAYNFRLCLTDSVENRVPITKPANYDSTKYELFIRLIENNQPGIFWEKGFWFGEMPNRKTDINNDGPFSTDYIGMNYDYPEGDYAYRAKFIKELEEYTKGFLFFLQNDERIPLELREVLIPYGYPKDEYLDNDHFSHQPYIREARRMVSDYVMTEHNCWGREKVKDGVAMASYGMDSHNVQRLVVNGMVKNEGDVQVHGFAPYEISYKSIVPKKSEIQNLIVPVCLSASHIAYGSIRMEPVFMALGQSAGIAAIQAIQSGVAVQEIDIEKLKESLELNPYSDNRAADILIDDNDAELVSVEGNWKTDTKGNFGISSLYTEGSKRNRIIYKPNIQVSGNYEIYVYLKNKPGLSTITRYYVKVGEELNTIDFDNSRIIVKGQTAGTWMLLGEFNLKSDEKNSIIVTDENSNGIVMADALILIKTSTEK
ncbi:FAD-dependent oxidoreductase [Aquiflexum lacus]|uniref:FAD-dependent oxidoreductase n=1 Tax=Aquiflexum lacus TaxID=2483805 RepID=UPI0018962C89|nr:FAD-dependent oxidoreductase [Aquiflexum lacus]